MNVTIAYTLGTGTPTRKFVAYDQVCALTLTGLSLSDETTYYAYMTSADGQIAYASRALIATSGGSGTATINLSTNTIEGVFHFDTREDQPALVTIRILATGAVVGIAKAIIEPATDPNVDVTTVGIDYATTTDLLAYIPLSTVTTKGDVIVGTGAATVSRLAVGANDYVLKADSTKATGLKWAALGAGTGDVVGPAASTDSVAAMFDGTTGKLLKDGAITETRVAANETHAAGSGSPHTSVGVGADYLHGIHSGLTQSSLSWDNSTHVLTLTDAHVYYYQGVAKSQGANVTCDIDDFTLATGLWFIYYADASGTTTASQTPWSLFTMVPIATIFWNGSAARVQWEGHNSRRDLNWHYVHHVFDGAYITPADWVMTAPASGSPTTVALTGGTVQDEDLAVSQGAQTNCVAWYQTGAGAYTWVESDSIYPTSVSLVDSSDSYTLKDVAAGKKINVWLYATTDASRAVYAVTETKASAVGYNTIAQARNVDPPNLSSLGFTSEMRLIYRVIMDGAETWAETTDYRASAVVPAAGGTDTPTASGVSFVPSGDIASTNVQAAIEELDTEKAATSRKLDDFGTPDDNTDLDATASAHGLLPKLSNVSTEYMSGTGVFSTPAGGGGSGTLLKRTVYTVTASGSFTGDFPVDDTAPQDDEGTQIWTNTFTPTSGSSKIIVSTVIATAGSVSSVRRLALFWDESADALMLGESQVGLLSQVALASPELSSPDTSAITFQIRAGVNTGTGYWGTLSSGHRWGAASIFRVTFDEYST